ncbi:MAG: hypothetical protein ACI8UO_003713 [Verrucomicrobiales bacterium]|jgi:hypothetical protein
MRSHSAIFLLIWPIIAPTWLIADSEVAFSRDILPILAENCFECHGPDAEQRKAELRLDRPSSETNWQKVARRIASNDPEEVMPPPKTGKRLAAAEIATLNAWIDAGAEYEQHWAFRPIMDPDPPAAIDRFISAALSKRGLRLSEPVSREKLIRRATFDLTGLPPKWSDVEAFVNDDDADAFAKVIDRLLESPAYGERWGRHWLDLARYADTHGGSAIGFVRFPFSYTYRDYVIDAFNDDVPYNRFVLEQLAADQLGLEETDPNHAALGFLTVGRQYRNRHDRLDDRIDVISRGLLGLTVSCARCHDHKFDPIPTTDYYALHATLAPSRMPNDLPLVGEPEIDPGYQLELEKREKARSDMVREQGEVFRGRLRMQVGMYLSELAKGVPEQDTATTFLSYRTEDLRPVILERWRAYLKEYGEDDPVFGPWHRLADIEQGFAETCRDLVRQLRDDNGDPEKFAAEEQLKIQPPKWNPRVLEALDAKKPQSFVEVAEAYGEVFADVNRRWLTSLLDASAEAAPDGELVPDQDARHKIVNSSIERQLRRHLFGSDSPVMITFEDSWHLTMLNRGVRDSVRGTLGAIDNLNRGANAPPRSMILREEPEKTDAFVFLRGNPVARGEAVAPRFLTVLADEAPTQFEEGKRRLGLAQAIIDPDNPLTRRVIVNWVWQHHFGRGLVRTPGDFGSRGDPPTHPDLLDLLCQQLLKDGWSLKKLHRRIMLTAAYQQASIENPAAREIDPDNKLLWRMPIRKIEMEAMRDSMLAVSDELDLKMGGRPFEEKATAIPRRSVYAFVNRDVISKLASTFDGADPSACTVKRPDTMVPQQTLFALNSDYIQDRAKALVQLPEIRDAKSDAERVRLIYERSYSRQPSGEELQLALEFIAEGEGGWIQFAHTLLASNEFHFID